MNKVWKMVAMLFEGAFAWLDATLDIFCYQYQISANSVQIKFYVIVKQVREKILVR